VLGLVIGAAGTAGVMGAREDAAARAELAAAAAAEEAEAEAIAAEEQARMAVLGDALDLCGISATGTPGIELGDGGTTLVVDHKGEDDYTGATTVDLFCIISALEAPSSVTSHMQQTTSMDGRQTETWNGITVSWSYHPDRGMDSVFTVE
jgi:hypothetical protein